MSASAALGQQGQVNIICSVQADWCNLIETQIGAIFVVTSELRHALAPGQACWLRLNGQGVSLVRG